VGAYIGTFSILASSKVKRGKVYAVEASKEAFKLLRSNISLNEISNIEAFHLALSDSIGICRLYHDTKGNWGHSTVKNYHSQSEEVECSTLEAFLDQNGITKCDLIKLNCEGAEYPILLTSSVDVLRRFNVILVLYHNDLWTNNSESELITHLESCGFAITLRNQSEKRGWIIAVNKNF
jgi:FkbM family methyltransferase